MSVSSTEQQVTAKPNNIRVLQTIFVIVLLKLFIVAIYLEGKDANEKDLMLQPKYGLLHKKIFHEKRKKKLLLFIGILSKSSAVSRRHSIRETWLQSCIQIQSFYCMFFSEGGTDHSQLMSKEVEKYHDMVLFDIPAGLHFSRRLLAMFEWAVASYEFDFFLRVDDDYFLCMDHLHYDIIRRPRKGLYWGYVHCQPNIVRIDEGWMITSADIVKEILSKRNTTLMCHPFGDQAASMWMKDSKIDIKYFHDNERVIHADAFGNSVKYLQADVCDRVLGLHGTSAKKMYNYWNITEFIGDKRTRRKLGGTFSFPKIMPFEVKCPLPNILDWRVFGGMYHHEPKLCHLNPTWTTNKVEYKGRGI